MNIKRYLNETFFRLKHWLEIEKTVLPHYPDCDWETIKLTIETAAEFAVEQVLPTNVIGDREGAIYVDGRVKTPKEFRKLFQQYREMGLLLTDISEARGGSGLPRLAAVGTDRIITAGNTSFCLSFLLAKEAARLLDPLVNKELHTKYVQPIWTLDNLANMCLTEPPAGSDLKPVKTFGEPVFRAESINFLDNSQVYFAGITYLVSGTKQFISNPDTDLHVPVDGTEQGHNLINVVLGRVAGDKSLSLFMVPRKIIVDEQEYDNHAECAKLEHKMGIHGSPTGPIIFDKSIGYLAGERGHGLSKFFEMMNAARFGVGLQSVALLSRANDVAIQYAKEREQPQGVPIINHPDIKKILTHGLALQSGLDSLMFLTAFYGDMEKNADDPEEKQRYGNLVAVLIPVCKAYASHFSFLAVSKLLEVLGGYGYCSEYPIEQFLRDLKIAEIYEGTNGIQALDLIGLKTRLADGLAFMRLLNLINAFCRAQRNNPIISGLVVELQKSSAAIFRILSLLKEKGKDPSFQPVALLNARNFLYMVGHAVLGWLLLEQAVLAEGLKGKADTGFSHDFLNNKLELAKYFVLNVTRPGVKEAEAAFEEGDLSAMKVVFED